MITAIASSSEGRPASDIGIAPSPIGATCRPEDPRGLIWLGTLFEDPERRKLPRVRPAPLREPLLAIIFAGSGALPALILLAIAQIFLPMLPYANDLPIQGSLTVTAIAMAVAVPFGLISAAYLGELASPLERRLFRPLFAALAGFPGVAFGWGALLVVGPALEPVLPSAYSVSAGLVLGVMLIPVVSALSQAALAAVPRALREAGWALGASQLAVVGRVVFPAARTGLAAAVLLATARAIGETMIVWIAAGPRATITTSIAQRRLHGDLDSVLAMGGVLLLFTLGINVLALRWVRRLRFWA